MKKLGIVVGKFAPLTLGHINLINIAATECETVLVVLSHDQRWVDSLSPRDQVLLSLNNRRRWLDQTFADTPHVMIDTIDESDIPSFPNGWYEYCDLLADVISNYDGSCEEWGQLILPEDMAIFSSEPDYTEHYREHLDIENIVVDHDRTNVPISATMIRENLYDNWGFLPTVVRRDYAKRVLVMGQESCVDGTTEYFNGSMWKPISTYVEGEKVLQYNEDRTATLVFPERYINMPCDEMYTVSNKYGSWEHAYTPDHMVVVESSKGNLVKMPFREVMRRHFENHVGFTNSFINVFTYTGTVRIDPPLLRLWVAISADGTINRRQWRIRLCKKRKIERLRWIISDLGIPVDERIYSDGYSNFYVPIKYGTRVFPSSFYHLDADSQKIFIEEIFRWDGSSPDCAAVAIPSYSTTIRNNADVVQFILSSAGIRANIGVDHRINRRPCYTVVATKSTKSSISLNELNRREVNRMIKRHQPVDGRKYCFTVPSGMLVLRRKDRIFITGNCGKTSLVKALAKQFATSWVEEYGRTYCETVLGGSEVTLRSDDYPIIAYRHKVLEGEALERANRVMFVDTGAFSTEYFHRLYEGVPHPVVSAIAANEHYDLVIILSPDVPWVDDGLRLNDDRSKTTPLWDSMLAEFPNQTPTGRTVYISADNYRDRFDQALSAVRNYLNDVNKGLL